MAGKNEVGVALLRIAPSLKGFVEELKRELNARRGQIPDVDISVNARTSEFHRDVEAARKAQEARKATIKIDADQSDLQRVLNSMRSQADIQKDIARANADKANAEGDYHSELAASLRTLKEELSTRNSIVTALKSEGQERSRLAGMQQRDLQRTYDGLLSERALIEQKLRAELSGEERKASAAQEQIRLRRTIGGLLEEQGRKAQADAYATTDSDKKRKAAVRDILTIEKELSAARARDHRVRMGELSEERNRRLAMNREATAGRMGVVTNLNGMTLFSIPNLVMASSLISGIAAAMGGIVAGAAAAVTSLGVMGGVLATGAGRVFGAFSALKAESGSRDQTAQFIDRQRDAIDSLTKAQDTAGQSARNMRLRQAEVADAYRTATREIRDQNMELQDSVLSQEAAAIGVARSRQRLREVMRDRASGRASDLDLQEARLGVKQSQSRLRQAQYKTQDVREDTRTANEGGIEGSATVQNAKTAVADAERAHVDALRDVARAQRELAQASAASTASQDKFAEAMAKLTPEARNFVNAIRALGPEWTALRNAVESELFSGLGSTITHVARAQLPELQRGMVLLAGTANTVLDSSIRRVSATFTEFSQNGTFDAFLTSVTASFGGFESTLDGVVRALTDLTVRIGPSIGRFFQEFGKFLTDGSAMWGDFGRQTVDGLTRFLPLFNRLSAALLPIAEQVMPLLEQALGRLTQLLEGTSSQLAGAVGTMGEAFMQLFEAAMPLLPPLVALIGGIADAISRIPTPVLTGLLAAFLAFKTASVTIIGIGNGLGRWQTAMKNLDEFKDGKLFGRMKSGIDSVRTSVNNARRANQDFSGSIAAAEASARGPLSRLRYSFSQLPKSAKIAAGSGAILAAGMAAWQIEPVRNAIKGLGSSIASLFTRDEAQQDAAGEKFNVMTQGAMEASMVITPMLGLLTQTGIGGKVLSVVLGGLSKTVGLVTGAFRLLTITMMANPIVAIIALVVGLGVALWAFFTKTELGRKMWDKIWNGIKGAVSAVINWIKRNWPLILAVLTGPIGLAVLAIVKHWDKIKGAFGAVVDWLKDKWNAFTEFFSSGRWLQLLLKPVSALRDGWRKFFDWTTGALRTFARNVINWMLKPINMIGGILAKTPRVGPGTSVSDFGRKLEGLSASSFGLATGGVVPGATAQVAPGGFIVNAKATAKNKALLRKLSPNGGELAGPGSGTSDSILGMFNGRPTSAVSNGEWYAPPEDAAMFGVLSAINGPGGLAPLFGLPRYDKGGTVGNAYEQLGEQEWNDQWLMYFHKYSEPGRNLSEQKKNWDGKPNSNYWGGDEAKYTADRDRLFQKWLDESGNRDAYRSQALPPGVTVASIRAVADRQKRNQDQVAQENETNAKNEARKGKYHQQHEKAWNDWMASRGGADNRSAYFKRHPDVHRRYMDGYFPPGDIRGDSVIWHDPSSWETDQLDNPMGGYDDGGVDGGAGSGYVPEPNLDLDTTVDTGGKSRLQQAADKAVADAQAQGIDAQVALTDLQDGSSYNAGGTSAMASASLIKLGVALALADQVKAGKLSLDSVGGNLDAMISQSSNPATNSIIDALGGYGSVNESVRGAGISESDYSLGRNLGVDFQGVDPNRMTAKGANAILSAIHKGANSDTNLDKATAARTIEAMRSQQVDTKFGAAIDNSQIAHKTGELGGSSHDSGYIFDGDRWVAVTIMTDKPGASSQEANNEIIKSFARSAYEYRSDRILGESDGLSTATPGAGQASGEALDRANRFVDAQLGKSYLSPPTPPANWDCSMLMSGIYAELTGQDSNKRFFTTEGGSLGEFDKYGFITGLHPGGFQIGVMRGGGGPNSHMSGTMPDGTNVESGGNNGVVTKGPTAAGASASLYKHHWTLMPDRWNPPGGTGDGGSGDIAGNLGDDLDTNYGGDGGLGGSIGDSSYEERDRGIVESTSIEDAMVGGVFSPKRFAQNAGVKALGHTWDFVLDFFGLQNSILSENNEYVRAFGDAQSKEEARRKNKGDKETNTKGAGTGEINDPESERLLGGYQDPNQDTGAGKVVLPGAVGLNANSSKNDVAAAIVGESQKRGYAQPTEAVAKISTGLQESGLNPSAIGGGGAWHGIFQQDESYPGRDDPNQNITGFLDRLDQKTKADPSADIWKRIFWLQQRPGEANAETAFQNGRQAYLTEIQSKRGEAQELYQRIAAAKGFKSGGRIAGNGSKINDDELIWAQGDEFMVNRESAEAAGPLMEFINSGPGNAKAALEALSGPAGAAANGLVPGSGAVVSGAVAALGGAAQSGLKPVADTATSFLSELERSNLRPRNAPAITQIPKAQQSTTAVDNGVHIGNVTTFDHMQFLKDVEDKQAAKAMAGVGRFRYS